MPSHMFTTCLPQSASLYIFVLELPCIVECLVALYRGGFGGLEYSCVGVSDQLPSWGSYKVDVTLVMALSTPYCLVMALTLV